MTSDTISLRARRIAIVGAGPSGVIAAKYLRAEKAFDKITLFEQRSSAGGIWTYTPDLVSENIFSVPQTNPHQGHQTPEWKDDSPKTSNGTNGTNGIAKTPTFLSPLYENLETNIPRGLMGFQDLDWPKDSQLFPSHSTVLQYIKDYSLDVQDLVQYATQVLDITPVSTSPSSPWTVTTLNLFSNTKTKEDFDAVIIANGHFTVPYIPSIPGISEWNKTYPNTITHSKYFRRPQDFTSKKVIVVGNSASGADISSQISSFCAPPLLWSSKSESLFSGTHSSPTTQRRPMRQITAFHPSSKTIEFENGEREKDVDAIVFATGYFYSLPFLSNLTPAVIHDGSHVHNTYKHVFYHPQPTLAFLALPQRVIPFPVAEAQAAVVARVYAGRLALPSQEEMQRWERERDVETGKDTRTWHLLPFPRDGEYINELSRWARSARVRGQEEEEDKRQNGQGVSKENGEGVQGKMPPLWGEWEFWCRENFPAIRRAFGALGEKRHAVRSIEEVGFDYQEHVRQKREIEGGNELDGV